LMLSFSMAPLFHAQQRCPPADYAASLTPDFAAAFRHARLTPR